MFSFTPIRLFKGSPVAIGIFALLLAVVGLASPALLHPQLDMAQFDFHTAESKKNSQWFFENFVSSSVLFEIHDTRLGPHIQESYRRFDFARKHKIPLEGVGAYVPTLETQERNLITWRNSLCKTHQPEWKGSTTTQKDFFAPFLRDLRCQPMTMSESAPPLYVDHLHSDGKWLTLWLPASEEQASLVRTTFPMAYSLRDWVKQFPETLASEIRWMVPFSLAAMFALLLIYFRNIGLAGTSLLSFLTAVGFVTGGHVLLGWTYSFVSLVGTLMICGMSVDYGIFMTDFQRNKNRNKQVAAVQSSILLAALTNILAFIPLLFCQHPVLIHLGRTLILGTAGAYIGAIWGIPFLATLLMRKHPATA